MHHIDLVLAHQKIQAFGVLGNDFVFSILNGLPVQLGRSYAINSVLLSSLQVVVDFSVKQQGFSGNAAHLETGTSQPLVLLYQANLQAQLSGTNGGRVSTRAGAHDGNVIDCFWHSNAPLDAINALDKTIDCK